MTIDKEFSILMRMHFSKLIDKAIKDGKVIREDDFKCEVCEDFINGHCVGEGRKGRSIADCILGKLNKSIITLEVMGKIN